jgi:hypothetical protein
VGQHKNIFERKIHCSGLLDNHVADKKLILWFTIHQAISNRRPARRNPLRVNQRRKPLNRLFIHISPFRRIK